MQFISSLTTFTGLALAQNTVIGLPTPNQTVASSNDNSLTGSTEIAVAIGLILCLHRVYEPTSNIIGSILYNRLFNPMYHEAYLPPYQNFTVTVPLSFTAGQA
ncbi:hypothetical protein N7490_006752 [Penicillium lividum]|nr:hypothetical protein N7490_006752 [Penicillium lividum]